LFFNIQISFDGILSFLFYFSVVFSIKKITIDSFTRAFYMK